MRNENVTNARGERSRLAYDLKELSEMLPVTPAFLRREGHRQKLKITRLGRRTVVLAEDLEAYLQACRGEASS